MKPTTPLTLVPYVTFLVFLITTATADGVVYDVSGKQVLDNAPYHLGPVIWAKGGGVKLTDTKNNNKICPYNVVQDPAEVNLGGRFIFTLSAKQKYLQTSYPLGIHSGVPKGSCNKTTFWQIPNAEAKAPSNLITTGGLFETAVSCFRVVDYPKPSSPKLHSYMLQHCPFVCGAGPSTCFNVSVYEDKGVRYLAARGGTPFEFVFQKAK